MSKKTMTICPICELHIELHSKRDLRQCEKTLMRNARAINNALNAISDDRKRGARLPE
jgi:hypothetical protein